MADLDYAAFGTGSAAETANAPSGMGNLVAGLYDYFGGLSKRAIGNSQAAMETGYYNPAPVVEAAMLPMGTGAIAGVPVKGAETVLGAGPIRAYHGSPHSFEKFDTAKIGAGEGEQAYGRGLYFAGEENVAKGYRDKLSPAGGGHMYEVELKADPAHFLDWDAKLGQQPEAVKKLFAEQLERFGPDARMQPQMMIKASRTPGGMSAVSQSLEQAGVPGIKYLDQFSRGAGEGSSNFVVFNDKLIDIMRKYGIALPGGVAAADVYRTRSHEPAI